MINEKIIINLKSVLYGSLLVFIFLIPLPHATVLSELSFYLAVFCAICLLAGRALTLRIRTPLIIPMLVFALWAIFSTFWAADAGKNLESVYKHVLKMIVLYVLLVSIFTKPEDVRRLMWALVLSVAAFALWTIINNYIILGYSPLTNRLKPDEINKNRMGHFCVVAFLLGLSLWQEKYDYFRRSVLCFALTILLAAILLTHSRTAVLATACGLAVFSWHHRRLAITGLTLLAVFLSLLFVFAPIWQKKFDRLMEGEDPRIGIYATYLVMAGERPLTGYGFETDLKKNWKRSNEKLPVRYHTERARQRPHNFLLDLMVRLGIFGVIIYCWLLCAAGRIGFHLAGRGKREFWGRQGLGVLAAFVALYTAGLVGNIFHIKTEMIMFTLMALLTILKYQESMDQTDSDLT
jgi:O-antigen ligase